MADGVAFTDPRDLSNDVLKDLLKTTTENLAWDGKFEQLQKYHNYVVGNLFSKEKVVFDGGTSIVRNVQLTESGTAKMTKPYATATPTVEDVQGRLRVEWAQATMDYSISRQEMLRNRGKAKLIDLVKSKRLAGMSDLVNLLEGQWWNKPISTTDDLNSLGCLYWIIPITSSQQTAATYGHQGTHPVLGGSTASNCGGIDCTQTTPDASRWKSYNDSWTNGSGAITAADVTKITRMQSRLHFNPPMFVPDAEGASTRPLVQYTTEAIKEALAARARASNDNLGADVGKYANTPLINNVPVVWVEQFDETTNPLYGTYPFYAINHEYFFPVVMDGDFFRETGPMNSRTQHDVFTTFVDIQFNFICTNRQRAGGIISRV